MFVDLFWPLRYAGNSGTLPSLPDTEDEGSKEDEEDLFSGAKDAAAYQQSLIVKKSIHEMLGRRSGPRWSLPHDYIGKQFNWSVVVSSSHYCVHWVLANRLMTWFCLHWSVVVSSSHYCVHWVLANRLMTWFCLHWSVVVSSSHYCVHWVLANRLMTWFCLHWSVVVATIVSTGS